MFTRAPRLLSNKENSTFPLSPSRGITSSPASKPRISGIGRAPHKRSHRVKPYARVPSVQRAKAAAAGVKKTTKAKPVLPPVFVPKAAAAPGAVQPLRTAKVPLRLPRPVIAPVTTTLRSLDHVPPEYVAARLAPQLPLLLLVSSLYRPYPQLNPAALSPTTTTSTNTTARRPRTMAFGIPQLVETGDEKLAAKVRGREPDMCLTVSEKGKEGLPRLVPINQLVYAVQCSYWPSLTAASSPLTSSSSSQSPPEGTSDQENTPPTPPLPTIDEESDPDASFSSSSSTDTAQSSGTIRPASPVTASSAAPGGVLHLPLLPLAVPSVATFPLLHTHLHLPNRSWLPALLALPPACITRQSVVSALAPLSTPELMGKLETLHAMWLNVCALGVREDRTWAQLSEAWGCVVGVLAARATGIDRMDTE